MLSKQDKLKYGEQLRRQMKQKEQKKKIERRGIRKSPTDIRIPIQPQPYFDNKQALQNRFQAQNIDYYGRPGGGAPNRQNNQQIPVNMQPQRMNLDYDNQQNQFGRMKTNQDIPLHKQDRLQNQNMYGIKPKQTLQYQNYPYQNAQNYGRVQQAGYQQMDQGANFVQQQMQSYNNNVPFAPVSYGNPNIPQGYNGQPALQRVPTDRSYLQQPQVQPIYQVPYQQKQPNFQQQSGAYNNQFNQAQIYQQPIQQISRKHQAYRQKTLQNEQLMEIHKKGGRNLLQLQNMTIDQQQVKQKQKQQMRKQLQLQMMEAQRRKQEQKEKIRREEIQEHRKNQQYLQLQKKRLQQQERKKNDKQRQLQQQNIRNLEQRKRLQQQAKQKAMKQKMKQSNHPVDSHPPSPKLKNKQVYSKQAQFQANVDETTSQISSSTVMDKQYNVGPSKQYYQNQRRKDDQRYARERNLQAVTQQIKRLKQHIDKQNQFFKKQIQKVKLESQMAQHQKKKAQHEIQNLKHQLEKKSQDDNQRLFLALQRQSVLAQQSQQHHAPRRNQRNDRRQPQNQYQMRQNISSLKPSKNQKLVKKKYQVQEQQFRKPAFNPKLAQSNLSEDGMLVSLHGDSKKIPINLPDDKLSMSRLSDYARQTSFFKNQGKNPYLGQKKGFHAQDSIAEQDEDRSQSRVAPRKAFVQKPPQKDQLDKLVQSRQKSRGGHKGESWGQLSSVNSDITKQIQQLLKKKDNPYRPPSSSKYDNIYNQPNLFQQSIVNDRPNSRLSNAGKRALNQRNGLQYEGASIGTIGSIAGNGTLGTVDIDRIQHRNQKRLNQLRNLGVQTINTNNGDQQFSKLDLILNKYKQSRVL